MPSTPTTDFADVLGPITDTELRGGVVELFDLVRGWVRDDRVDLVVLSARRLACLYRLLVEAGMEPIDGCLVVSDRFLDVTTEWRWREVVVLDDSVVLGTTLRRLCRKLRTRRLQDGTHPRIRSAAVVVDKGQAASYLLAEADLTPLYAKTSAAVEKFSTGVVQALFARGVPFFSDFPVTESVRSTLGDWAKWLDDDSWFVADVTAPLLSQRDRFALVQIPKGSTVDHVQRRLFPAVSRLVENFKIRSYVNVSGDGDRARVDGGNATADGSAMDLLGDQGADPLSDEAVVRFVPIAMLRPASPVLLDEALAAICAGAPDAPCPIEDWKALEPESKHRLVQMFASAALLRVAIPPEAWHRTFDTPTVPWDVDTVAMYFGEYAEALLAWFDRVCDRMIAEGPFDVPSFDSAALNRPRPSPWLREPGVLDVLWQQRELLEQFPLPAEPDTGHLTRIGLLFAHCITSVFGYVSAAHERPQRRRIARLGSVDEYDEQFGDEKLRVLNQGITLRELTNALGSNREGHSSWSRSCLALGIDIGNDLGVIVPDTRYDPKRDLVYRCYRMGETATLVDKPLSTAVWNQRWDPVTREAGKFPVASFTEAIITHLLGTGTHARGSVGEIAEFVLDVLPGKLTERYDGEVTDLDRRAGTFTAKLTPGLNDRADQLVAVMNLDKVPKRDVRALKPGSRFRWSIYERDARGALDSISRISLTRSPDLDLAQLSSDARALAGRGLDN